MQLGPPFLMAEKQIGIEVPGDTSDLDDTRNIPRQDGTNGEHQLVSVKGGARGICGAGNNTPPGDVMGEGSINVMLITWFTWRSLCGSER